MPPFPPRSPGGPRRARPLPRKEGTQRVERREAPSPFHPWGGGSRERERASPAEPAPRREEWPKGLRGRWMRVFGPSRRDLAFPPSGGGILPEGSLLPGLPPPFPATHQPPPDRVDPITGPVPGQGAAESPLRPPPPALEQIAEAHPHVRRGSPRIQSGGSPEEPGRPLSIPLSVIPPPLEEEIAPGIPALPRGQAELPPGQGPDLPEAETPGPGEEGPGPPVPKPQDPPPHQEGVHQEEGKDENGQSPGRPPPGQVVPGRSKGGKKRKEEPHGSSLNAGPSILQ